MYVAPVFELSLVGVAQANVPNQERILIRPTQEVDLTEFAVLLGYRADGGSLIPLWDYFYWFGNISVSPPSWICLYTGTGTYSQGPFPETGELIHSFYWGRSKTIFPTHRFVPLLIRIGGLVAGNLLQPPAPKLIPPDPSA